MTVSPPATKKELFSRLRDLIHHRWYELPDTKRCAGTGGCGSFLEDLLGLNVGSQDIADSVGWEIKYYTKKTHLITLFHKEPKPTTILRHLVSKWGWKDQHGRLSFRHTIRGRSDRFKVETDSGQIIVRPLKGKGPVPIWTHDDLLNIAGGKLRRLILVEGHRDGNKVRFGRAECYENLHLENFIYEVIRGTICIDFDVREKAPGTVVLRNHGTKFRVAPDDICRLYTKKERFS